MLRVAICDDEAAEVKRIEEFIKAYDDLDVSAYTSSKELAWAIEDGKSFDLYLLDIVMPPPDGIELARLIRRSDETAAVIFLTSHEGHALDAFRVRASQYLTKPVSRETLRTELDSVLASVKAKYSKTFLLKTKSGIKTFPFHRIAYCELESRVLCCVTAGGEKHRSVTLRMPFDDAVSPLLDDGRFIRPHTSFAVNLDYTDSIQGDTIIMKNGSVIPITRRAAREVKAKYLQHFFKEGKFEK